MSAQNNLLNRKYTSTKIATLESGPNITFLVDELRDTGYKNCKILWICRVLSIFVNNRESSWRKLKITVTFANDIRGRFLHFLIEAN